MCCMKNRHVFVVQYYLLLNNKIYLLLLFSLVTGILIVEQDLNEKSQNFIKL
jgi:hypothetical protein